MAQSLVRLIVAEISEKQTKERGFTAEQLSRKFATDPSAIKVSGHLFRQVSEYELKRLLVEIVPDAYFAELEGEYPREGFLRSQSAQYRSAFAYARDEVKRSAMRSYAKILRETHGTLVEIYERKFFLAEHLGWVDADDEALVKEHLIAQLDDPDAALIAAAAGIGAFLSEEDASVFVDRLVRVSVTKRNQQTGLAAKQLMLDEYANTPRDLDPFIAKRLADGLKRMRREGSMVNRRRTSFVKSMPFTTLLFRLSRKEPFRPLGGSRECTVVLVSAGSHVRSTVNLRRTASLNQSCYRAGYPRIWHV